MWFLVTGSGSRLGTSTCTEQMTFDTVITVYTGDCDNLECVGFSDDDRSCFNTLYSTFSWESVEGQGYYILVHGFRSSSSGFSLTVFDAEMT